MTEGSPVLHRVKDHPDQVIFFCPGCQCAHTVWTGPGQWSFNGDFERPTFSPSILVRGGRKGSDFTCHSFVRDGQIEFCGDSHHALKGRTVPLEPF
jgi:hypothetical protein